MKNKKCPNCLCDINLDAIVCPFCKTQIKSQMKFLPTLGFKPPEVVSQDIKPLHNTKINIDDIELPQFLKKSESELVESENDNFENNYLEVEEKIEQIPYTPKILNIRDLPQNDNLFIESEEENVEIIKPSSEFDFNGDLMQEIKAYFEMPSPNSQDYEQKHLDIIENMSIDDIIKGSLDTHKKEHKEESFGLMFGQEEKKDEDLPSYNEIDKNTLESSEKVKKIYDKITEQRDYNSYMYDTLDTSLDALGFVDEKVDFGDLKKKLSEPEPSIHNIVEHIPFKIPKLPLKRDLDENDNKSISIDNDFIQSEKKDINTEHFEFNNFNEDEQIDIPTFINTFEVNNINEEIIEAPEFINNPNNINENVEQEKIQEINVPHFINEFDYNNQGLEDELQNNEIELNQNIRIPSFIDKIIEIKEYKQIIESEEIDKLFELLQIRGKTLSQEIDKTDPYHREPFEIDNLEIVEVKDYFKEEIEEEIVKASEINVDINSLKELIDFAGVQEEPKEEQIESIYQDKEIEIIEKNIPKFQAKNVLRVSDEKIEEKKGEMSPTRIVRDAISELESLKQEFLSESNEETIPDIEEKKVEINTDLSTWFNNEEINNEIESIKDENKEEKQSSVFDLSTLNDIQLEFDKAKNNQEESLETLNINEENDEIIIPSFINENLEKLEPVSKIQEEVEDEFNIQIPEDILNLSDKKDSDLDNDIGNVFIEIKADDKKITNEAISFKEIDSIIIDKKNERLEENLEDEIKVPEFLNNISIDSPKNETILNETILEEDSVINNVEFKNLNTNKEDSIQELSIIEELKVPEPPKFVVPPPPPPPTEDLKLRVPPPPPQEARKNIPPPPPIENKELNINSNVETSIEFSIPTFDTTLTNNQPKIRNPITTTLNTTLGARSTTNQEAMDLYIYARDLCLKKEYNQALDILEKSVRIDPAFEQAHILLSRTYLKLKNVY